MPRPCRAAPGPLSLQAEPHPGPAQVSPVMHSPFTVISALPMDSGRKTQKYLPEPSSMSTLQLGRGEPGSAGWGGPAPKNWGLWVPVASRGLS